MTHHGSKKENMFRFPIGVHQANICRSAPILHAPGSSRSTPLFAIKISQQIRGETENRRSKILQQRLFEHLGPSILSNVTSCTESPSLNKDYKILKALDGPYNNQDENEARKGTADCSLSTYHRLSLLRAKPTRSFILFV